jgi:hypothetical protein
MSLNKKLLAGAIVGLLFSANASANVLDGTDAYVFATELVNGTDIAGLTADAPLSYNFSANEVRYGRFSCTGDVELSSINVSTTSTLVALGAVNGNGTNTIFFSMTGDPSITAADPTDADTVTVTADVELQSKNDVDCEFALYDLPSQAQAGGASGLVVNSGTDGYKTWITRDSGFVFTTDPNGITQAVANVEDPAGAYFGFVGGGNPVPFGNLTFQAVPGVWDADLADITLADIFDTDSTVTVAGDMSAAVGIGDDATFTIAPIDAGGDTATFDAFATEGVGSIYYFQTDVDPIQASEYTATLNAVANTGYEVDDVGPIHIGDIVRNGTELQAPLVQIPAGWLSRIALTNTGNVDRDYEMTVMTEAGVTASLPGSTGTIPAGGTVVIDLPTSVADGGAGLSFTGGSRGTINVNVSAPDSQIQGLYQIVNPASGSISNHVMVRPGTN